MTSSLPASFECQDYKELTSPDEVFDLIKNTPLLDWVFQLKYDGIWAKVVIEKGYIEVFSKTGQLKHRLEAPGWFYSRDTIVLIGEFMFGSQWSQHPDRAGLIYVFDCLVMEGQDISTLPWRTRKEVADARAIELGHPFAKTECYTMLKLADVWQNLLTTDKYEGLIIRNKTHSYFNTLYKLKVEIEDDFVVINPYPGNGKYTDMLGGYSVGKYTASGNLVKVMDVGGGFSDKERAEFFELGILNNGRVMRVKGKGRFSSGALRHPNYVQFRDDKNPGDCKL